MNTCRTCAHWSNDYKSVCSLVTYGYTDLAYIDMRADDDQGLDGRFVTSPDFGCILHKPKQL